MQLTNKISERLEKVKNDIAETAVRIGRNPADIKIIVVTKTATTESIKEVIRLGVTDLGENRLQNLKPVSDEIAEWMQQNRNELPELTKITWHMIGHLQRNKVRHILKISQIIHSVDTLRLAEEINKFSIRTEPKPQILLQVNCSEEPQKYGVPVGAAIHMAEQLATMPNLSLVGLMTMAPLTLNKDLVRACFMRTRELFEEIRISGAVGKEFRHISMGMSQDYTIAVEEGATMLRIGSAIFS